MLKPLANSLSLYIQKHFKVNRNWNNLPLFFFSRFMKALALIAPILVWLFVFVRTNYSQPIEALDLNRQNREVQLITNHRREIFLQQFNLKVIHLSINQYHSHIDSFDIFFVSFNLMLFSLHFCISFFYLLFYDIPHSFLRALLWNRR